MYRLIPLFLLAVGCAHRAPADASAAEDPLLQAITAVNNRRCDLAFRAADAGLKEMPVDTAETQYRATRIRSTAGALMGLLQASQDPTASQTVMTTPYWADLLYIKGYCQIESNDLEGASATFQRELTLIPGDAPAACELGHLAQERQDWSGSIALFEQAHENVLTLEGLGYGADSGGEPHLWGLTLVEWKGRALRGIGFSYVELREFDKAEAAYKEAIAINPGDAQALKELNLIASMRQ